MEYGYIRVSSREQNEDRQRIALTRFGIAPHRLYIDKQSGSDFIRPAYIKLLKKLKENDRLVVQSIDRLGRNYAEILAQWRHITHTLGVDICVLNMPLLDTRRDKDLMGTFLADVVLQILSFVAENERENIRARQAEGIAAARARGVRFGRPPYQQPPGFADAAQRFFAGQCTARQAADSIGMSPSTFWRHCQSLPAARGEE